MHATPLASTVATAVAIDLTKDVFELACADAASRIVERRDLTRNVFAKAFDNHPALQLVMEACGSTHFWARRFQRQATLSCCSRRMQCDPTCAATRPTAATPPDCSKPTAAARSSRYR